MKDNLQKLVNDIKGAIETQDGVYAPINEVVEKMKSSVALGQKYPIYDVRLALIAFEESKHKLISKELRHEYAVKVVDNYISNL